MSEIASGAMALAMIAAFLLIVVGFRMVLKPNDRRRGLLMIAAAAVLITNVLIWTL